MKVVLLNAGSSLKRSINKDVMAGFGEGYNFGKSIRARILSFAKRHGVVLPSLMFGYLAAILHQKGIEVEVKTNEIPEADMVIIHSSMVEVDREIEYAREIKQRGIKVGFIGPLATYKPELYLESADFVVSGEPESAFMNDLPLNGIVKSKPVEDLDGLPFPYWEVFDTSVYKYSPTITERPFLPMLASRGCPMTCGYCPYRTFYAPFRKRSPKNVLDEIEHLNKGLGAKSMLMRDPIFTFDRDRTLEIAEGILERQINLKWACETRSDLLDEKLIDVLYRAGVRAFNIGIESQDLAMLERIGRKPVELENQERIIDYCYSKKIKVGLFFVLGLPGDTEESIRATIDYALELKAHVAQFFIFTPMPGTPGHEKVKHLNPDSDFSNYDCYTPVYDHENISRDKLNKLKEEAFVRFYFRPEYIYRFGRQMLWK